MFKITKELKDHFFKIGCPEINDVPMTPYEMAAVLGYLSVRLYEFIQVHENIAAASGEAVVITDRDTISRWVIATVLEEAGLNGDIAYFQNCWWLWNTICIILDYSNYTVSMVDTLPSAIVTNGEWHHNFIVHISKKS